MFTCPLSSHPEDRARHPAGPRVSRAGPSLRESTDYGKMFVGLPAGKLPWRWHSRHRSR